jgi:hypothetical protein
MGQLVFDGIFDHDRSGYLQECAQVFAFLGHHLLRRGSHAPARLVPRSYSTHIQDGQDVSEEPVYKARGALAYFE